MGPQGLIEEASTPPLRDFPTIKTLAPDGAMCWHKGMGHEAVEVKIRGVLPTSTGCAVFLGCPQKTFVIYVDPSIGNAISMALNQVKKERPLTHDLIHNIFTGLEVELERVIINDVQDGTFFARIFLSMKNELGTKILELDARPSDSIVLALQASKPIHVLKQVIDSVEDMTELLERILKEEN